MKANCDGLPDDLVCFVTLGLFTKSFVGQNCRLSYVISDDRNNSCTGDLVFGNQTPFPLFELPQSSVIPMAFPVSGNFVNSSTIFFAAGSVTVISR